MVKYVFINTVLLYILNVAVTENNFSIFLDPSRTALCVQLIYYLVRGFLIATRPRGLGDKHMPLQKKIMSQTLF